MTTATVMGLVNNAALLLALGILYDTLLFDLHREKIFISQLSTGGFVGLLGIAVMMTPWEIFPGVVFDTRSVLLSISGLFFGGVPTLTAIAMTAAFRMYSGGTGMWTGVAVIITSGGIGLIWHRFRQKALDDLPIIELYVFGILVHIAMLLWMFSLPRPMAWAVLSRIGWPVLLIFPLGTVLLGRLLSVRQARKKDRTLLQESQQELADIFSLSLDMICIADINTSSFLKVNPAFTRILGFQDTELINRSFLDFVHPDDVQATRTVINEKLKKGETVVNFTNRHQCKDKSFRLLEWVSHPIPDRGITYAVAHDITDRKKAEDQLRASEAKVKSIMDNLPIGIAVNSVDPVVKFDYMNDNFCKYYRTTRAALAQPDGFWNSVYTDPDFRETIKDKILADCASGDPGRMYWADVPITRQGEKTVFITAQNIPLPEKQLMISIVWDVTDRKHAEEEIRSLNRDLELRVYQRTLQLEEAHKELEDFVYSVSHDLRAPLRSISGFSEIINRRHTAALNEEGRHYFDNIIRASMQMGNLIDDLLRFSRLGRTSIKFQDIALDEVFKIAMKTLTDPIKKTGARICLPEQMPLIHGDLTLVTHSIINLLENALKYHKPDEPPRIDVKIEVNAPDVVISIADNGIGIAPEYHEKIFAIFQRLHSQEAYQGTGIGLAAVKKTIQLMGGNVWVESDTGKGSVFKIQVAMGIAAESKEISK